MNKKWFLILGIFFIFVFTNSPEIVYGQEQAAGVANPIPLTGPEIVNGAIVCTGVSGYKLCDIIYESGIFGVVSTSPAAQFIMENREPESSYVISEGTAVVRVSGVNGAIETGTLITTSRVAGVGQRADRGGYVLGSALEPFTPASPDEIGEIAVSLHIHPTTAFTDVRSNLLEALRAGLAAPVLTPLAALRYILSAFVIVSTFILCFVYFGRIARTSIESIARNPLASRKIEFTVLLQVFLMVVIAFFGFGIAYLILAL
ncbi:MAG: hypothetical protein UV59_C0003G0016 [Candidatus Gottesmanbacteria bacterium GW2011_GWA1_43_11]|uniref:Uncharacterized protein n=1 Tax=Candidatus Gottesmanbacteria bacterium GW2011_GWA1_43_11 TaxID=1618436 RepID=A0A0G1ESH7_9BACT|nr:MAG: hypothetical protein UV59_C0003G0016 [Candidatus Gottesmanbacteria bacterium GW2011_GWA1_43_11]